MPNGTSHSLRAERERERNVLQRTLERAGHAVARLEAKRKTLNWFNPLHWRALVATDAQLDKLRGEMNDTKQKYVVATTAE